MEITEYKFNMFTAVGMAEGFVEAESQEQILAAWQYIYDNDIWMGLQGWFGRTVRDLLEQGLIIPKKND